MISFASSLLSLALPTLACVAPAPQDDPERGESAGLRTWGEVQEALDDIGRRLEGLQGRAPRELRGPGLDRSPDHSWPRPDPRLDAEEFAAAVRAASGLSGAEILERSGGVDVDLLASPLAVEAYGGEDSLRQEALSVVERAGLRIDPDSPLKLMLQLEVTGGTFRRKVGGRVVGEHPVYHWRWDLAFQLAGRVLRGEQVHHTRAELASYFGSWLTTEKASREVVAPVLVDWLDELIRIQRARPAREQGSSAWVTWLDRGPPEGRKAKFDDSFRSDPTQLEAGLSHLSSFSSFEVQVSGADLDPPTQAVVDIIGGDRPEGAFALLHGSSCREVWLDALGKRGASVHQKGAPTLHHGVNFSWAPLEGWTLRSWASRTSVSEREVLVSLGDGYGHIEADVFVDRWPGGVVGGSEGRRDPDLTDLLSMLRRDPFSDQAKVPISLLEDRLFQQAYQQSWKRLFERLGRPGAGDGVAASGEAAPAARDAESPPRDGLDLGAIDLGRKVPALSDFTTTDSGLRHAVLAAGGSRRPRPTETVRINTTAWLVDGTMAFDSRPRGGDRLRAEQVMKGIAEGMALLGPGGSAVLIVPPELGYGDRALGGIPASSTLVVLVELIEIL